ncbi:hypothetical protein HYR99_09195 [Candidatus Poribacteria bacterium]|nr:hypothetical protein [Candidatus Poribacteria bacterium]
MSKQIVFTVEIIQRPPDRLLVGGRCCEGVIVRGDTFEAVYRYLPAKTLEDYGKPRERIEERPVSLRVEAIWAYRQWLNKLYPGMTARLELAGVGGELLREGDVLGIPTRKSQGEESC